MSKPKLLLLTTCISLALTASAAYGKQTLYKLGNSPFSAPLATVEDLQSMIASHPDDLKKGFELAGQPQFYDAFINQIKSAQITTVQFDKGTTMDWMVFRKKGQIKITNDVTWGAEEPFTAFSFPVDYEGKRYNMIVPLKCGNMTLVNVSEPPAPIEPNPVAETTATPQIEETVRNFNEIFDVGYMYEMNAAKYVAVRFGAEYHFNENLSVMGLIGGTPQLGDTDGASGFLIDFITTYRIDKFAVGLGLGGWLSSQNTGRHPEGSRLDAIVEAGYTICARDTTSAELFVEGRSGVDEFDEFDRFARIAAGVRFRF